MTLEYRKQLEVLAQRARAESLERGRQAEIANAARIQREMATLRERLGRDNSRKNRRRERALARLEAQL